ncbi:Lysozyme [Beauveria bassiana D1-5]|uniref:Lysozyme n=1 Tax=Beauveria bassiana D1-5 TaxID=1245745 RepID=A0A0A2V9H7_BEABA|nr:Lysozyme [Beauveria bassiana D1-5]
MSGAGAIAIAGTMLTDLEGVRYTPYYDVAGVLTVCYGHTGADIIKTKTYSATECQAMLDKDLVPFARSVERSVKVPTTEYQKAALISFSYNVGVTAFERSSLLRQLNAGNYQAACDGLRQWTYAGGKQWKGLMNRRDIEREVCMNTRRSTGGILMNWQFRALLALFVLSLAGGLIWSANHYHGMYLVEQKRADAAEKEVDGQRLVIATQTFNMNRFNQIAGYTNRNNSLIDAGAEKTVIEYREILRLDKTCDLPVPADIAGGLLDYTNRLRASAMHADSGQPEPTGAASSATGGLTYCQAVLWIKPLLAAIDKANSQLAGVRQIEAERK